VGAGRIDPRSVPELLAARDRRAGCDTAPPQALYLARIFYSAPRLQVYRCRRLPFLELL